MSATSASGAIWEWVLADWPGTRLNAVVERDGDRSLVTSTASTVREFIDGGRDVRQDVALVLMAPWSDGPDGLNAEALATGEAWLAWLASSEPEGLDVVEVRPDDEEPVLVQVTADGTSAKYQFQAYVTYHKERGA